MVVTIASTIFEDVRIRFIDDLMICRCSAIFSTVYSKIKINGGA